MIEPGQEFGTFRVESELGSGAMGTVYKAVFKDTGQTVALKLIAPGHLGNETIKARFEREAGILKQLRHPHIVRLFATGRYKKTPFFAMEYVQGESLDKVLERRGRLPWEEVVRLGKQLCDALQHAHEKGIIHRDLKPSNLMVLQDGTLKLTDFGIAKDTDVTALTGANSTVGTAAYMSPEQCRGEKNLTAKSDLYSLGVVFFELLTGEKPFKKDTPVEMFLAHVNDPFPRPATLNYEIPSWLDNLVCHLMEKLPERRPVDAAAVARTLHEIEAKVADQRSAGLDAATARVVDRPGAKADDADREAARLLRGGRKRRRRARVEPFYQKNWFVAVAVLATIAGLSWLVYWGTRPATPETFLARWNDATKTGDTELARTVLKQFADSYPQLDTPDARRMRTAYEDAEAEQLARQMHNRLRRNLSPDGDAQQIAFAAIRAEDAGSMGDARRRWSDLAELSRSSKSADDSAYGWLSRRSLQALDEIGAQEKSLIGSLDKTDPPASEALRRAALAARFERFGDAAEAAERWGKLRDELLKEFDQRPIVLLAAFKANQLRSGSLPTVADAPALRLELVRERIAAVEKELKTQNVPASRREARKVYSDIVALYGDSADPAMQAFVRQAIERLPALAEREKP